MPLVHARRPPAPSQRATPKVAGGDKSDGRRLRAARNHEAVVGAVLAIVRERTPETMNLPGAAEVAARAGVSERTVFRHFADLDSLFMAAAAKQRPVHETYVGPRPDAPDVAGTDHSPRAPEVEALRGDRTCAEGRDPPQPHPAGRARAARAGLRGGASPGRRRLRPGAVACSTPGGGRSCSTRSTSPPSWATWDTLAHEPGLLGADRVMTECKVIVELMTALLATVPKAKRR